jgi:integrase
MAWIEQKGSKFLVRWRDPGNRTARGRSFPSEADAVVFKAEKEAELAAAWVLNPRNPDYADLFDLYGQGGTQEAEDAALSVQGYIRTMILANRELRQTTTEGYLRHLRVHIEDTEIGRMDIRRVTPEQLTAYWAGLTCGPGAAGNVARLLRLTFRRAVRTGLLEVNPLERAPEIRRSRKPVRGPVRPLTVAEVELLADSAWSPRDRLEILVMAYGGLRAGEVGGLAWADVDFERSQIHLRQGVIRTADGLRLAPLKTDAARRVVTLPRSVMDEMAEFPRPTGANSRGTVFHGEQGGLRDHIRVNRSVQRAAGKAGVRTHAHALRHTAVSLWIADGASPVDVQHMVGHADIGTTLGTYSHLFTYGGEDLAARMERRREAHRNDTPL